MKTLTLMFLAVVLLSGCGGGAHHQKKMQQANKNVQHNLFSPLPGHTLIQFPSSQKG